MKMRVETEVEVRNCPFCNSELLELKETLPRHWAITCNKCKAIGPYSTTDQSSAILAWNVRYNTKGIR